MECRLHFKSFFIVHPFFFPPSLFFQGNLQDKKKTKKKKLASFRRELMRIRCVNLEQEQDFRRALIRQIRFNVSLFFPPYYNLKVK